MKNFNSFFNQLTAMPKRLAMVLTVLCTLGVGSMLGATTTYTFTNKSWDDSSKGWTSGKDGAGYLNSGVQVTKNGTGANATSKNSFTNISKIEVNYCTNKSGGAGTIVLTIGSTSKTLTVSKSGGTTMRTLSTSFDPNVSGNVTITVNCTTNSIYVGGITITTVDAATCTTAPIVSATSSSNITTNSATVTCSEGITSLGSAGCSITSYGFVYSTSSNPTISDTKVQVGTSYTTTGTFFDKSITGLSANTTYYVRPYATNGYGTAYGTQTSFKTKEIKYTVTYNANGATGTVPTDANEYASGATVTVVSHGDLAKIGYSFTGWSDGTNVYEAGDSYTMPAKDVTFTAQWTINTYTVTWIVDGEKYRTNEDIPYNTSVTAPDVDEIPCGDVIAGWTDAENGNYVHGTSTLHSGATPSITITNDKTFYAVFADYAD